MSKTPPTKWVKRATIRTFHDLRHRAQDAGLLPADYDYTRFICVSFEIAYRRLHRARGDALRCNGAGEGLVAATGFATGDILALDVTDPAAPRALHPVAVAPDEAAGTWTAAGSWAGWRVVSRTTWTSTF